MAFFVSTATVSACYISLFFGGKPLIKGVVTGCVASNVPYAERQALLHKKNAVHVSGLVTYKEGGEIKVGHHIWSEVDGQIKDMALFPEEVIEYSPGFTFPAGKGIAAIKDIKILRYDVGLVNIPLNLFASILAGMNYQ